MKKIKPYDSGKIFTECVEQIDINAMIREFNQKAKIQFIKSQIELDGLNIELTTSKTKFGERLWFACPECKKRVGKLYKHPTTNTIACRKCNGLYYSSQKYKGMLEEKLIKFNC